LVHVDQSTQYMSKTCCVYQRCSSLVVVVYYQFRTRTIDGFLRRRQRRKLKTRAEARGNREVSLMRSAAQPLQQQRRTSPWQRVDERPLLLADRKTNTSRRSRPWWRKFLAYPCAPCAPLPLRRRLRRARKTRAAAAGKAARPSQRGQDSPVTSQIKFAPTCLISPPSLLAFPSPPHLHPPSQRRLAAPRARSPLPPPGLQASAVQVLYARAHLLAAVARSGGQGAVLGALGRSGAVLG